MCIRDRVGTSLRSDRSSSESSGDSPRSFFAMRRTWSCTSCGLAVRARRASWETSSWRMGVSFATDVLPLLSIGQGGRKSKRNVMGSSAGAWKTPLMYLRVGGGVGGAALVRGSSRPRMCSVAQRALLDRGYPHPPPTSSARGPFSEGMDNFGPGWSTGVIDRLRSSETVSRPLQPVPSELRISLRMVSRS